MPVRVISHEDLITTCDKCGARLLYQETDVEAEPVLPNYDVYEITCPNCHKQTEVKK